MSSRLMAKLAAGACIAVLAGCGGDDEAPIEPIDQSTESELSTVEEELTEEEFISQADGLCAEGNLAIASAEQGAEDSETTESLAISEEREVTEDILAGLEELQPPDDPTGQLDAYLA